MATTIKLPLKNVEPLRRRLAKLAARAASHGMPVPEVSFSEPMEVWRDAPDAFARIRGDHDATRRVSSAEVEVTVSGGTAWAGEWAITGHRFASRAPDGRRSGRVFEFGTVPDEIKARPALCCDHCQSNRKRVSTLVLERRDGGKTLEVGASCTADFFGSAGARLTGGLDAVSEIYRELAESTSPDWRHGWQEEAREESRLVLAVANRVISEDGFTSSADARNRGSEATYQRVLWALEVSRSEGPCSLKSEVPLADDYQAADDVAAWLAAHPSTDGFVPAARAAVESGAAGRKEVAVLCAAVWSHRQELDRSAQAVEDMRSVHVGRPGDRIEAVVTVSRKIPYSSQWGDGHIVLMRAADGNLMSWATGSAHDLRVGHAYDIKGTVKAHGEARSGPSAGASETTLTRVKVLSDLGPARRSAPKPAMSAEDENALDDIFANDGPSPF